MQEKTIHTILKKIESHSPQFILMLFYRTLLLSPSVVISFVKLRFDYL